jgi:radical SAM protein with 4Fe4S-binding SPASM domain
MGADSIYFRSVFVRDEAVAAESLDDMTAELARALDGIGRRIIECGLRVTVSSPYFAFTRLREEFPENVIGDTVFSDHPATRLRALKYPFLQLGKAYRTLRCESPERLVRVDANGVVSLCKGFVIGNVSEQPLDTIWNGPAASFVRQVVSRKSTVCDSCDHFRFCLDTASRRSVESTAFSGSMKRKSDPCGDGVNPLARAFYDELVDHRTEDLMKAIRRDRLDMAMVVLATGLDPDIPGPDGRLPVAVAAELGSRDILRLLVDYGASPPPPDRHAQSPLSAR